MTVDRLTGAALAGGLIASLVLAGNTAAEAEIRSKTDYASYTVSGTTPLTVLRSMLQRARHVGHSGALATTKTSFKVETKFDGRAPCRVVETDINAEFLITLPRHPRENRLSNGARIAFRDFHAQAKRHEEKHRAIYLTCAKRLERAVGRLPPAANCRALKRTADQLWAKEMQRCSAENKAFDAAESKRLAKLPLLRKAVDSFESQVSAQIEASKITSFKMPDQSDRPLLNRVFGRQ